MNTDTIRIRKGRAGHTREEKSGYTGSRYAPLKICPFLSLFHPFLFFTINDRNKIFDKDKQSKHDVICLKTDNRW